MFARDENSMSRSRFDRSRRQGINAATDSGVVLPDRVPRFPWWSNILLLCISGLDRTNRGATFLSPAIGMSLLLKKLD